MDHSWTFFMSNSNFTVTLTSLVRCQEEKFFADGSHFGGDLRRLAGDKRQNAPLLPGEKKLEERTGEKAPSRRKPLPHPVCNQPLNKITLKFTICFAGNLFTIKFYYWRNPEKGSRRTPPDRKGTDDAGRQRGPGSGSVDWWLYASFSVSSETRCPRENFFRRYNPPLSSIRGVNKQIYGVV